MPQKNQTQDNGSGKVRRSGAREDRGEDLRMLYWAVYARKLKVDIVVDGQRRPCPLDWLDSFAMRNFTGSAEFDDTLPTGEGRIEAGYYVDPGRLAEALSAWLTKRGKGNGRPVQVEIQPE
jgi:hypothetical protein